jgi:hypothetical protein
MLAVLCKAGYRKEGFADFDDKIFDGEKLYLIDMDELKDLYFILGTDFREILLDPTNKDDLIKFRDSQAKLFKNILKDALFDYKNSLASDIENQTLYINSFYQEMGWKLAEKSEIGRLTTFEKDYMTLDRYIISMTEED